MYRWTGETHRQDCLESFRATKKKEEIDLLCSGRFERSLCLSAVSIATRKLPLLHPPVDLHVLTRKLLIFQCLVSFCFRLTCLLARMVKNHPCFLPGAGSSSKVEIFTHLYCFGSKNIGKTYIYVFIQLIRSLKDLICYV